MDYYCNALRNYSTLCQHTYDDTKRPRCIYYTYYEELGGHIHRRSGRDQRKIVLKINCIMKILAKDLNLLHNGLIRLQNQLTNQKKS